MHMRKSDELKFENVAVRNAGVLSQTGVHRKEPIHITLPEKKRGLLVMNFSGVSLLMRKINAGEFLIHLLFSFNVNFHASLVSN